MTSLPRSSRSLLLAVCALSACAAADAPDPAPAGPPQPVAVGVSGHFLTGLFAQRRADMVQAASDYRRALAQDPASPALREAAFEAALLSGADDVAQRAAAVPNNPAAQLILANAMARAGHWAAAQAAFAAYDGQPQADMLRPLLVAWAQQGAGETDAALATLRALRADARFAPLGTFSAAMVSDLAGRDSQAGPLYRDAILAAGSFTLRLGMLAASWQARHGEQDDARITIRNTVAGSPDLAIAEPALLQSAAEPQLRSALDGLAESYLAMAAASEQRASPDAALVMLRLALDVRPDFAAARLLAAQIQALHGHARAALETLAPIASADPLSALVRLRRAQYLAAGGQPKEAEATLLSLAQDLPQTPAPLAALAEFQQRGKHFQAAAATFTRAIARVSQPSERDWPLFYERGIALERSGQWPQAEADFRRALSLSPDQPLVLNYFGYALTERNQDLPEARRMLAHAVDLRPNDGSIVDSLGWLELRQGEAAAAVQTLERAVELEPEDATINGHLGDAYMALGRSRDAELQWRRALIFHPDPADQRALQAKLAGANAALRTAGGKAE